MTEINEETIAEATRIHAQRDLILNSKGIAYALQCIELAEIIVKHNFNIDQWKSPGEDGGELYPPKGTRLTLEGNWKRRIKSLIDKIESLEGEVNRG